MFLFVIIDLLVPPENFPSTLTEIYLHSPEHSIYLTYKKERL